MSQNHVESPVLNYDPELLKTIEQIGIARFVGRINAGVIPTEQGYAAVEHFVAHAKERPFVSKVAHMVLGRVDSYALR
ncbi:hypothetical protein [Hydrogenophaga sp. ZJX-1]|uniref:hypothetical protein n=1 Tax=Hydrogenophaga sp. ZJX-1 TaxID=3404778 RepID=UPI003B280936